MVRRNAPAGEAMKVAVPDIQQGQAHRQVGGQGRGAEMFVHGMGTGQKISKSLRPDRDGNGQPDRRPHRIAPPHPVPKAKSGGDAKRVGRRHIGRQRRKVACGIGTALRQKPGLGGGRVGHGLDGSKGLAGNQKDGAVGFEVQQLGRQLMAIDVAHKVQALATLGRIGIGKRIQRQHRHLWPQV